MISFWPILSSDALEEKFLYLIKIIMDISEKVRLEEGFWFSPQADYIVFLTINSTKVIYNLEKFSIFQGKPATMGSIMLFTFSDFLVMLPNFVCFSIALYCQLFKGDKNVATNPAFNESANSSGYNYYKPFTHDFTYIELISNTLIFLIAQLNCFTFGYLFVV